MASAYSPQQLSQFLSYINIPSKYHLETKSPPDLAFLTALVTYTITAVPYENLSLHYSQDHSISLDPQHLLQKIVGNARGRGGYCMEGSLFFTQILRGFGFDAYPVGVRIRPRVEGVPQGKFRGFSHIVNIVTLPSTDDKGPSRYMVDVAFGGDGACCPLPLVPDHVTQNIGTQEIRLTRDFIPDQTNRSSEDRKLWIYQYRNSPSKPWNSFFAFSDAVEFLPQDFDVMNWYTSASPESFQTFTVIVVKFLRRMKEGGKDGEEEVFGKRTLVDGVVKENLGGRTELVEVCRCEEERVEALRKWFGMELTESEREGIRGWRTELRRMAGTG